MAQAKKEVVYGIHAVRHSLKFSPEAVLELWIKNDKKPSKEIAQITRLADKHNISTQIVNSKAMDDKARSSQHQGVILIRQPYETKNENQLATWLQDNDDKKKLFLVLDNVQDPHNLGACLRTADAANVDGIIVSKDKSVGITSVVSKVASGAVETVPFYMVTNLARTLRELKQHNIWVIGTAGEAESSLYQVDFNASIALVLGAEGQGLRENTRKQCDQLIRIPMRGTVESLNVSVATGVCLFEVLRQREKT